MFKRSKVFNPFKAFKLFKRVHDVHGVQSDLLNSRYHCVYRNGPVISQRGRQAF